MTQPITYRSANFSLLTPSPINLPWHHFFARSQITATARRYSSTIKSEHYGLS